MIDNTSNHPRVAQSPQRTQEILERSRIAVHESVEARFHDAVMAWAAQDTGPFPDRAELEREVRAEYELLCVGLGRWSAVSPAEVFPSPHLWW